MTVNIFCIGDIVGQPGRAMLADYLKAFIDERHVDLVVCNAENAAGGSGITPQIFDRIRRYGVDVVTMGDHVYRRHDILTILHQDSHIVRPANLSPKAVGRQWTVVPTKSGNCRVGVAIILGQMYMGSNDSPWAAADRVLDEMDDDVRIRVIDFHAEATSEKIAMGWHLNGRVSVVFGTHTHVPTADARILDKGTAFISDVGMTGSYDSVLGRKKDVVLGFLTTSMPARFDVASEDPRLCGVLASVDADTGLAKTIERIEIIGHIEDDSES